MSDLDDGPEQKPLPLEPVQRQILQLLPVRSFDLLITHSPQGEYTRHRRHEEVSRAVLALWEAAQISTQSVYLFAYEDGGGAHLPRAILSAHRVTTLPEELQAEKYRLITQVYGFAPATWEARVTPLTEAFWCFDSPDQYRSWIGSQGV